MKILHISEVGGGVKTYIDYIVQYNQENEHYIATTYTVDSVNSSKLLYLRKTKNPINIITAFLELKRIIKKYRPDIVHGHSSIAGLYLRILAMGYNIRLAYTPNAFSYLRFTSILKNIAIIIEKVLSKLPHVLIPSSPSEELRALKQIKYSNRKVESGFYNSILIPHEKPRDPIPDRQQLQLLFVGRFTYQKNPINSLEVVRQLIKLGVDVNLIMIGSGYFSELEQDVFKFIKNNRMEHRVKIIPWMAKDELNKFYASGKASIFILTSRYESFGYVTCEALANKIPAISFDIDGSRDLIKSGYNGYLVNNIDEMVNKILFYYRNRDNIRTDGCNGRLYVNKKYNIIKNIKRLENIYAGMRKNKVNQSN